MENAKVGQYNERYVSIIKQQFGYDAARFVCQSMTMANDLMIEGADNITVNIEVEDALQDAHADDMVIRLSLIGSHACLNGWDDAAPFFMDEYHSTVEEDQDALIDWVKSGHWIGEG